MKVPLSWLNEYVSLDGISSEELTERITTAGLEVAGVEYVGVPGPAHATHLVWGRDTIRVGEIVSVDRHPNADRLSLVTVEYGESEPKTVVTGASNVRAGLKVAYATLGAKVINGYSDKGEHIKLKPKKLRGVRSEGMVLSELELGLSDEHEGILELPDDAPVGMALQDYMGDMVVEIELTPNLGRVASMVGVAREVAALFDRELKMPSLEISGSGAPVRDAVRIDIRVPEVNPRFTAALIRGVKVAPSPFWVRRRLQMVGVRAINNLVDATNYAMMELGQPLHAFDYDKLLERAKRSGHEIPTIIMRMAEEGEKVLTLDKEERQLDPADILVTDTAGIISIAGIMGGAETEVSSDTTNVLLEAASWNFISTRRSSMRHNLFSEAAYRFSRAVHPAMAIRGNLRGAHFMAKWGGGEISSDIVDAYPNPPAPVTVELDATRVNRLLGTKLTLDEIAAYLRRLEFAVQQEGQTLQVTVPDHREDVAIPADLVEEVGRVHGLEKLPLTLIDEEMPPMRQNRSIVVEEQVADLLVGAGLTQTISYYMSAPEREAALLPESDSAKDVSEEGYVVLTNPVSQERRVMRRNLLVSALENLQTNLRHRSRVAIFEIGFAYLPQQGALLPKEERRLALAITGAAQPTTWLTQSSAESDFYTVKGVVEEVIKHLYLSHRVQYQPSDHPTFQPGRAATLLLDEQPIGTLGELHPKVRRAHGLPDQRIALAELNLEALIAAAPETFPLQPIPRFPAVMQDLAVVVDQQLPNDQIEHAIRRAGAKRLTHVELFDVYEGQSIPEGKKSLAYSLRYIHPDKTLTDKEVAKHHKKIAKALRKQFDAQIRGEDL
ncbi:MAG: phenylalanine--tRNA ligase subunit beta [Ardenticatenaceae bacterium]